MARFLHVGRHWINLDMVLRVELVASKANKDRVTAARVHYADGKYHDFRDPESVTTLEEWLREHEAE